MKTCAEQDVKTSGPLRNGRRASRSFQIELSGSVSQGFILVIMVAAFVGLLELELLCWAVDIVETCLFSVCQVSVEATSNIERLIYFLSSLLGIFSDAAAADSN